MTFPGANASVYYNEAGEPMGWDYPDYDEPDFYPADDGYDEPDVWDDPDACAEVGVHAESCRPSPSGIGWVCTECGHRCDHDH